MTNTTETTPLLPPVFRPLPLGAIRPLGWLHDQLRIQADGLSGHLDEFWPDVADSAWIGGQAEGWERGPYWLDGLVPLAYLLDDDRLKGKVGFWLDYILTHQHEDGWLGPVRDTAYGNRGARFGLVIQARWEQAEDSVAQIAWAKQLRDALTPHATGGAYANFLGLDERDRVTAAHGSQNMLRLRKLKSKYDPNNVFRLNPNAALRSSV